MIDIKGLNRAEVLAALYNEASPGGAQRMSWMQWQPGNMTVAEAESHLASILADDWIDYLGGRALKIKFEGDQLEDRLYDREYGDAKAHWVVMKLRAQQVPS